MALTVAGVTIVSSLLISGAVVSRISSPSVSGLANVGTASTFFYHASHQQSLRQNSDGQIYLDAQLNDRSLHFRVDPTQSKLLLTPSAASAAGLTDGPLTYSGRAMTPDGEVRTAPVMIKYLHFGTLTLFNVQADVAESPLPESILGVDFLKRFESFEMRQGNLVLHW
jgi:aspartyl protease family protein